MQTQSGLAQREEVESSLLQILDQLLRLKHRLGADIGPHIAQQQGQGWTGL